MRRWLRAVAYHPIVRIIRSRLRNAWWALRRRDVENPPFPAKVRSILFVCLGNICRSPFGAERTARLLAEMGRGEITCTSAGIRPSQDRRSPEEACRAARPYAVSLDEHRPRALTRQLMASHDVIIVMEVRQLAELRATYPEQRDRIVLLPLFDDRARSAYERYNIDDPFGQPITAFEKCYARMEYALRRCIERIPA